MSTESVNTTPTDPDNYDFASKCIKPKDVNLLIHHGRCTDGFTSALCCWRWRNENGLSNEEDAITYYPATHGRDPPDVTGKTVVICDFSYRKSILDDMMTKAKSILILDHHKTAQKDLEDVADENKVFDMDHSGAYIAWRFFFGYDVPVPRMILYVEDNDIWKKALPNTREFTSFIFTVPMEFEAYAKFFDDEYLDNTVFPIGKGMVMKDDDYIEYLGRHIIPKFIQLKNRYYFAGHLSSKILRSDMGNHAFTALPYLNFSVIYSVSDFNGSTSYSLRSTDERTDVGLIAKQFGGGGHRNAAGCGSATPNTSLPARVVDNYQLYYQLTNLHSGSINNLKVAMLNNGTCAKHMARYLMQERTEGVQEASFILTHNEITSVYHTENTTFDAALVYIERLSYDTFGPAGTVMTGYIQLRNDFDEQLVADVKAAFQTDLEFDKYGLAEIKMDDGASFNATQIAGMDLPSTDAQADADGPAKKIKVEETKTPLTDEALVKATEGSSDAPVES